MRNSNYPMGAPIGDPAGLPDVGDMRGSLWISPKLAVRAAIALTVLLGITGSVPTG